MRVLLLLLLFSSSAISDVYLKYGMVVSDEPNNALFGGIWLEQDKCRACLSIFAVEFHTNDLISNRMVGIDYGYNIIENADGVIKLSFGYAVAEKAINDSEQFNFHLGGAFIIKSIIANKVNLIISYDHFSNGKRVLGRDHLIKNIPIDMLSVGISF
jgi:hypothetical protein